ncbi:MAG: hypothetical protein ACI9C4_000427 [Paraglaciecola sp.]|jgi:hypothetical protein
MNTPKISRLPTQPSANLEMGFISDSFDEVWQINNQHLASRAVSCLLEPQLGDQVLYTPTHQGVYILAIIVRSCHFEGKDVTDNISVPNGQHLTLSANTVSIVGQQQVSLQSLGDISVNAVLGKVSISARDLLQTVQQTVLQSCQQLFSKAKYEDRNITELSRHHAKHQVITAEKEMKLDAQRINMG